MQASATHPWRPMTVSPNRRQPRDKVNRPSSWCSACGSSRAKSRFSGNICNADGRKKNNSSVLTTTPIAEYTPNCWIGSNSL
jgi:hypothetical protein